MPTPTPTPMSMTNVKSTNLKAVGYREEDEVLGVVFNSGAIYQYRGVPKAVYEGLLVASSTGSYFHKMVKCGGFPFTLVSEEK